MSSPTDDICDIDDLVEEFSEKRETESMEIVACLLFFKDHQLIHSQIVENLYEPLDVFDIQSTLSEIYFHFFFLTRLLQLKKNRNKKIKKISF